MAGSITKVKSPRTGAIAYRARYRDRAGKQHEKRFQLKKLAQDWLDKQTVAQATGTYAAPALGKTLVADWWAEWWKPQTHLAESTRQRYEDLARVHVLPTWGHVRLEDVTRAGVASWVSAVHRKGGEGGTPLSASTVRQAHGILVRMLTAAVDDGLIGANPALKVKNLPPAPKPRKGVSLTIEQVRDLVTAARIDGDLILTLAVMGLRVGELAGVTVADLHVEKSTLTINKSTTEVWGRLSDGETKDKKGRDVDVPPAVLPYLVARAEGRQPHERLFTAPEGGPLRLNNWRKLVFRPAVVAAGLPPTFRVHDLRHTAASIAFEAGGDVKVVQHMLGHASGVMTINVYADPTEAGRKRLQTNLDERLRGLF